jgi:isopentenyl diphosphate isomerase/L-lactate dehydrogenase-like FMN-dependent dehydrogenase
MEVPRYVTVDDYEAPARERLPVDVYDFIAGGAGDEWTLQENIRAFERWIIRPRFLRGAIELDLATEVLGAQIAMPILIAPWAYQRMVHEEGELASARAAASAGTIIVVSSTASQILDAVASAADGPKWWQLYLSTDRGFSSEMLAQVVAAGYAAICWTVDLPAFGLRHRDTRNVFEIPEHFLDPRYDYDPNITWADVSWIRERTPGLPLLVKGILTAEDARTAVERGVDGIVVSNHGGRQLDRCPASVDALPEVVDAVAGRIPVLVDGGVRRGVDVFTALALGASAVLVGRPAAWGLTVAGEQGVADVLRILREELENTMALTGCQNVGEITRELVVRATF